jgi:hypothetical protein
LQRDRLALLVGIADCMDKKRAIRPRTSTLQLSFTNSTAHPANPSEDV